MLETVGLAPQITIRSLLTTSSGSADAMSPYTLSHAAPIVAAQIVWSATVAPIAAKNASVRLSRSITAADELYVKATTDSRPDRSIASRMRPAIVVSASSQLASRNSPAPFGPTRISGVRTRSGA